MLDTETLDLGPRATPWQLSIVEFVMHADGACVSIGNDFTTEIPPALAAYTHWYSVRDATTLSDATVEWTREHGDKEAFEPWYEQFLRCNPETGIGLAVREETRLLTDLGTGLQRLGIDGNSQMWAKGADFDFPIFENFMRAAAGPHWKPPYHYRNKNCMRTWLNEAARWNIEVPKPSPKHNAFQDCVDQILLLGDVRMQTIRAIRGIG